MDVVGIESLVEQDYEGYIEVLKVYRLHICNVQAIPTYTVLLTL